jgi:hypothetical protein
MHWRAGSWACLRDVSSLEKGEGLCALRKGGYLGKRNRGGN